MRRNKIENLVMLERKMIIKQLNYDEYKGKQYKAEVRSDKYLLIEPEEHNMRIEMGKKL
jgi:hypothetical protein